MKKLISIKFENSWFICKFSWISWKQSIILIKYFLASFYLFGWLQSIDEIINELPDDSSVAEENAEEDSEEKPVEEE